MKKAKKLWRIVFGRTTFVVLFMLLQIGFFVAALSWMEADLPVIYGASAILSVAAVIYILNEQVNSSFKIAWMIPVLIIPVFGVLFYLFVKLQIHTKIMAWRLEKMRREAEPWLRQDPQVSQAIARENPGEGRFLEYMNRSAGFPAYSDTGASFFPLGDSAYEVLKEKLRQAKHYIFMEYFIVERGMMWGGILEILEEKAAQGVEVRVMYDGMCSMMLLPYHYPRELERRGIHCKMFSPVKPTLSTHHNNRDHRKITVIDGHTAFTGGINLADEYINQKLRFGHWKDTAIMVQGDAAQGFAMMFLQMWNMTEVSSLDYGNYLPVPEELAQVKAQAGERKGYLLPYGDSPMDKERVGEQVYLDILNRAVSYVHIMTPYLILDEETENALIFAAKRGVDVKLIMPHIPDKKYAYLLARTYYPDLLRAGVQIYEYTPGFVHAKEFICDGQRAVVGTINLDFRSLYLHFECGLYLYQCPQIQDVEQDFQNTLAKCGRITPEDCRRYSLVKWLAGRVLRLIAPLM